MSLKTVPNSPSISRAYPEAGASVDGGNGPPHPDRASAASVSQRRDRYSDTASRVLEVVGKKHRTVAPWRGGVNATTATGRARRAASCFALSLPPILRRPHDETDAVVRARPALAHSSATAGAGHARLLPHAGDPRRDDRFHGRRRSLDRRPARWHGTASDERPGPGNVRDHFAGRRDAGV